MRALTQACWRLLTFRAGGDDMPHSPRLLAVLLAATLALDIALASVLEDNGTSPLWILVRMGIALGLLFLLLQGAGKAARFVQTAIALTLATLTFSIFSAPLLLVLWPLPQDQKQISAVQALLMLLLMPVFFWLLWVRTWILRGATEYRWPMAFLVSLALLVAEATLTLSLMKMFTNDPP